MPSPGRRARNVAVLCFEADEHRCHRDLVLAEARQRITARRPPDTEHAEHMCSLGLIADEEGHIASRCAQLTQELVADRATELAVGHAPQVTFEGDEFPVDASLAVAAAAGLMAAIPIRGPEARRLQRRGVLRTEQLELADVRVDLALLGARPARMDLDLEAIDRAGTNQGQLTISTASDTG